MKTIAAEAENVKFEFSQCENKSGALIRISKCQCEWTNYGLPTALAVACSLWPQHRTNTPAASAVALAPQSAACRRATRASGPARCGAHARTPPAANASAIRQNAAPRNSPPNKIPTWRARWYHTYIEKGNVGRLENREPSASVNGVNSLICNLALTCK